MKEDFFKFPSTPHLALLDEVEIRGDKVMSEVERKDFLRHKLVVEEKVDGANLGVSFDSSGNIRSQNRGSYLHFPSTGQWKKLPEWLAPRIDALFEQLTDRYILFGEWCYAQHSVVYNRLPDWFLGFDIYDKITLRFLSCTRRDEIFRAIGLSGWADNPQHIAAVERIFSAAKANNKVACHHGMGPAESAKFVNMGSMLCQIGNEMRMLTAATSSALKAFREAIA